MSTLRADNFADRLGTGSIGAQTLLQGTAKAWHISNGTGTIAVYDSFNVASLVDNATGDISANFSVARPSVNFVITSGARTSASIFIACPINDLVSLSLMRTISFTVAASPAPIDAVYHQAGIMGDPA